MHARQGSGEWREVSVNSIAEEAVNLAYHGARPGHPDVNVEIVKHLDAEAGAIECFLREIMRIVLNLLSNAICAANKKCSFAPAGFVARVDLTIRAEDAGVALEVRDNGIGVPPEIRESIFLPFLTTKPAGESMGLGLSLSHDAARHGQDAVQSYRTMSGGVVSFGTAYQYFLHDLIAEFRRRHPEMRVRVVGQNSSEVAEAVGEGRLEAGLVMLPVDEWNLQVSEPVWSQLNVLDIDLGGAMRARFAGIKADYGKMATGQLREIAARAGLNDIELELKVPDGRSYAEIIEAAEDLDADLIIVAAHKESMSDYILGTTAARVVRHSNRSVLVAR